MQMGSHPFPLEKTEKTKGKSQRSQIIRSKPPNESQQLLLTSTLVLERFADGLSYLLANICSMQFNSR